MSLTLFEGPAGTGKTTQLLASARQYLGEHPLAEGQRVLALTKYHGSRKRLDAKLNGTDGLGVLVTCSTVDSFAWMLVRRWRGLAGHLGLTPTQGDFQGTTSAAGRLLQEGVGAWVGMSFPLVLVDEMQDCQGGDLALLEGLEPHVHCIAGADTFQDLSGRAENEAILWASRITTPIALTTVHRTRQRGILAAAHALRAGTAVYSDRTNGFDIQAVQSAPQAGAITSWRIKSWSDQGEIAVISPTTRARSLFVDQLTTWIGTNAAKTRYGTATAGPYQIAWEDSDEEACERLRAAMGLPDHLDELIPCSQVLDRARAAGVREVIDWVRRQRFVHGREVVGAEEVRAEIQQVVRRRRAFGTHGQRRRVALTVHQAKNREFECVVVLWPLQVRADIEQQRRLLYNAITRAKLHAVVIVEDPRRNRLAEPLFTGTT